MSTSPVRETVNVKDEREHARASQAAEEAQRRQAADNARWFNTKG